MLVCLIAVSGAISPAQAQSQQTLVSNIGQGRDAFILRQDGAYQAFTTGNNALGYDLGSVEVYFTSGSASADHITARLHRLDSGEPGEKVADLGNPDKISFGSNIFTAPAGTVLSAGTSYAVVFSINGNWNVGGTYSRAEDAGSQSDWSIEDTFYNLAGSVYTAPLGRFSLMIRVNGAIRQPPSGDATLSDLTLTDAGDDIELTPAFDSGEVEYGALVPTDVQAVTLDATANHSGARLRYMDGKELAIQDIDPDTGGFQVALMVGENVFKVQVEAENGEKRIYTVNVTRQGAPISLSLDAIAGDDVVNIREKAEGFTIGGYAGVEEMGGDTGISVTVRIGSETLTATMRATGEWSLTVPPDAQYITEPAVTVTVNASGPHMSTAPELARDLKVDLTPPVLVSAVVDEDRLTLTFSEPLPRVDVPPDDFLVSVNGEDQSGEVAVDVDGNIVTLTLPMTVTPGDTVKLSYTSTDNSGVEPISDKSGNMTASLRDHPVENGTPPGERCAGSEGEIRLMDGGDEKEGRVEICADEDSGDKTPASWGTICNDYWTNDDADVACRALGYDQSEPGAGRFLRSPFGAGPGPIWLDDMLCNGNESTLLDCPLASGRRARDAIGVHNCKSSEVVGVRCMAAGEERTVRAVDATVEEGAQLAFPVLLSEAVDWEVSVLYRTSHGSATPGVDYEDVDGKLIFAPGETQKTVTVVTLDDSVDDDGETLTLHLQYAFGARIETGTATGTIGNSDPLPKGWLTRFGRTSASHVVDMLGARFDEAAMSDNRLTLGGQALSLGAKREPGTASPEHTVTSGSLPESQTREATPLERTLWTLLTNNGGQIDTRRLISQSSFDLSLSSYLRKQEPSNTTGRPADDTVSHWIPGQARYDEFTSSSIETISAVPDTAGHWSLWGRGALTRFGGVDDAVNINGDVLTGLLGVDYARDRWLAGVALAYHDGDGSYRSARNGDAGRLDSTLVSVNPYLRYALTDRLSVWGTLGYGSGTLQLQQETRESGTTESGTTELGATESGTEFNSVPGGPGDPSIETDIQTHMGAAGLRGVVYAGAATELALKSDVLWVRTSSDAAAGMQAVDGADTSRLRLLLSGRHQRVFANDALLTPTMELGLRYDGGAAETGFGMEIGGGVQYADPAWGLVVETRARALLAHEDGRYREWGVAGSVQFDPGSIGRGLSLRLDSAWGQAGSGAEALWQRQTTAGIAQQYDTAMQGRFTAELGYGMDVPWTYGILTPYGGMELAGSNSTLRLGWRFTLGQALSLSLDGERRRDGRTPPEHALMLRTSLPW